MHFVSFYCRVNSDNKKPGVCLTGVNCGFAARQFGLIKAGGGHFLGDIARFFAWCGLILGRIIPVWQMDLYPFLE